MTKKYTKVSQFSSLKTKLDSHDVDENGCWIYRGCTNNYGYCLIMVNKKLQYAHRLSYEFYKGTIPEGMTVDHTCFNRRCINPDHLRLLSNRDNARIHRQSQLKLWCKKHNCARKVLVMPSGRRTICPKCMAEYSAAWKRRHKEKCRGDRTDHVSARKAE